MSDSEQARAQKKSLGPLAWIGIGGLLVIAVVTVAGGVFVAKTATQYVQELEDGPAGAGAMAAEAMVRINSALRVVQSDRETGTIAIREKESGKTVSVSCEDLKEGRPSFEGPDSERVQLDGSAAVDGDGGVVTVTTDRGVSTIGASADAIDLPDWLPRYPGGLIEQAGYTTVSDERHSGTYSVRTTESSIEVEAHWLKVMGDLGLEVQWTFLGAHDGYMLRGSSDQYEVNVTISNEGSETSADVAFEGSA